MLLSFSVYNGNDCILSKVFFVARDFCRINETAIIYLITPREDSVGDIIIVELARQPLLPQGDGGKSGLHRAGCQVTPGRREPMESATENIPPMCRKAQVRVKWCGKSAPRDW